MLTRYDFEELKQKALNGGAKEINALGEWFERYGVQCFNGEFYDVDNKYRLYPLYEMELDENGEILQGEAIGYELR